MFAERFSSPKSAWPGWVARSTLMPGAHRKARRYTEPDNAAAIAAMSGSALCPVFRLPVARAQHALPFGQQSFHFALALPLIDVERFRSIGALVQDAFSCRDLRLCMKSP